MKKVIAIIFIMVCLFSFCTVYATGTDIKINEETTNQFIEIKEKSIKELEDYTELYGNSSYGMTAYILNIIRIYSIPACFVGIAIAAIYQYVLGVRKIDVRDRGLILMVSFITIFVICQILPLIFAIVVKSWRG